jgi:predicted site-specific integrase-resolvase
MSPLHSEDQGNQIVPGLLKAREIAESLGVSEAYIRRHTAQGDFPCIKLPGGPVRYDLQTILNAFRKGGEKQKKHPVVFSMPPRKWV